MQRAAVDPRAKGQFDSGHMVHNQFVREISIRDGSIRLGQLLKLAGMVSSGADVKGVLSDDLVTVNGEPEVRRGRQIRANDIVKVGSQEIRVISATDFS